ncbi:hypothetical protein F5Y16DRAFT_403556 [Xylariaceae sp. FL0255]|nr:hypothetical protein F5Y16DRAFT_403556 [Xylariaceae sp. FL0255]
MARPRTPALDLGQPVPGGGPTSPPETPTTASPTLNRMLASGGRGSPLAKNLQGKAPRSNIRPLGGNKFSYSRDPRPEAVSPQSSHSSDEASEASESGPPSSVSEAMAYHGRKGFAFSQYSFNATTGKFQVHTGATIQISEATFAVEDLSDCSNDSDSDIDLHVLQPDGIDEGDESDHVDIIKIMEGMDNMTAPFEPSDSDVSEDDDFQRALRMQRQAKKVRRMKSGSISKRTISERGSDGSDREDVMPWFQDHDPQICYQTTGVVGDDQALKQHRRVRRKAENRLSFRGMSGVGPIPEVKEPDSDGEILLEIDDSELYFQELPFFRFMEIDSE